MVLRSCRPRSHPRRSATRTRATTTWPPSATTPSGASTSARSAASRCSQKVRKALGGAPGRYRALARDRRRNGLLHAEPAARGRDRQRDLQRHLAGHARDAARPTPRAWDSTSRPRASTPSGCRSRTQSFDLVLGHAVLHHIPDLQRAFAEFERVLAPGGTLLFAGEPSRYGDRLARVPKRAAGLAAPLWRRAIGARPAAPPSMATPTPPWSASSTSTPSRPRELARRGPRGGLRGRARHAARSCWRTGSAGRTARSRPRPSPTTCRGPGASTPTAATCCCSSSTAGCSSRGCRRRSSTTS